MASPTPESILPRIALEPICTFWATLTPPEIIGPVPEGIRVNFYATAGEISGPKMKGKLRPVGGDWLLLRKDGIGVLDVRTTMELEGGALVYTIYGGVLDLGPNGYEEFSQGILPPRIDLKIAPRFFTAHPDYLWLNRLQGIGNGVFERDQLRVIYDIYAVR